MISLSCRVFLFESDSIIVGFIATIIQSQSTNGSYQTHCNTFLHDMHVLYIKICFVGVKIITPRTKQAGVWIPAIV